jgi:hypothetical protein
VLKCFVSIPPKEKKSVRIYNRFIAVILLVAGIALLAGCPARESIARIDQTPGRFAGREITIAGRVVNSFGAIGTGLFQLDDGTGRMWVFSESFGIPGRDAKLAVTGRVEEGFSFEGKHFAMILRETRRPRF